MRYPRQAGKTGSSMRKYSRLTIFRLFFIIVGAIFIARLFYVQVLNQQHYKDIARNEQFKQLEIEPERGSIYMRNGNDNVALAVNESRYTVFADSSFIKEPEQTAKELSPLLGMSENEILLKLSTGSHYEILMKKASKDVVDKIAGLKLKGIAWKEVRQRIYPQGEIGSTVLGFVNDEGDGQYGIEGSLNNLLKGKTGSIRAITDINGVPLVQNKDNVVTPATPGENIVLSIDQSIQRIAEDRIKEGVEKTGAKSGSVTIMEVDTGRVAAMASYPSYAPSDYAKVEDASLFTNKNVSDLIEPGSIIKTLTTATALDTGAISKNTVYFDPGYVQVDDSNITNVLNLGSGDRSIFDILRYSLNTGAVYMLKQMGGGEINDHARTTFYTYLTNRFLFDQDPKIEQQEATKGYVQPPNEGYGLNVRYADMSFGQGLSMTLQQFSSALCAVLNGGTYYQPTLVYGTLNDGVFKEQNPKILRTGAVSQQTSSTIKDFMEEYVNVSINEVERKGFVIGGKTGTAQVPRTDGVAGYRDDVYNATFTGFVGKNNPKYLITLRLDEGSALSGFSGFTSAKPVFVNIVNDILDGVPISD